MISRQMAAMTNAEAGRQGATRVTIDGEVVRRRDLAEAVAAVSLDGVLRLDVDLWASSLDPPAAEVLAELHLKLLRQGGRLYVHARSAQVSDTLRRRGLRGLVY